MAHNPLRLLVALALTLLSISIPARSVVIGRAGAARWTAQPTWSGSRPSAYSVTSTPDGLRFSISGPNSEIPWVLRLSDTELDGDSRYLLLRYRARGMARTPGNYLLHGFDGPPGGRTYIPGGLAVCDGAWHTFAVDMGAMRPLEPLFQLAIKVIADPDGQAVLDVRSLSFSDVLPHGAMVSPCRAPATVSTTVRMGDVKWRPASGWVTNATDRFAADRKPEAAWFQARGPGLAMRWTGALPAPLDLKAMPVLCYRYRMTGTPAATGYALWLGSDPDGARGPAWVAATPHELVADGRWHIGVAHASPGFTATHVAVGIDCLSPTVALELDTLTVGSTMPDVPIGAALPYRVSGPTGWRDFVPCTPIAGGRPAYGFAQRMGVAGWFAGPRIAALGIPFEVGTASAPVRATGFGDGGPVEVRVPRASREIYLLTGVACPDREPYGLDVNAPRPQERLAVPEKAYVEIRYTAGPLDRVIPREIGASVVGLVRGLGVHVVHPAVGRTPVSIRLVDRMQTASIGLVAVTARLATPKQPVAGPVVSLPAAMPLGGAAHAAAPQVEAIGGAVRLAGVPGAGVSVGPSPLFEVEVGGRVLPSSEWSAAVQRREGGTDTFVTEHSGTGLRATVRHSRSGNGSLRLGLELANTSGKLITATVRFPIVRGIRARSAGATWYLAGKRGGIINRVPVSLRLPLGEQHPMQVDGFFGGGQSLACVTHDTVGRHHFVHVAKDERGGEWWPEYPQRDIGPAAAFRCTDAELTARTGDWRTILSVYRDWLRSWYKPPQRKLWFERVFAFISRNSHYDSQPDAQARGLTWPTVAAARGFLGGCDYLHLYGWGASRVYGDWGDYDHYDETVGGLDRFRSNLAETQRRGVPVGLYVDGYLNSDKGESSGANAREWAILKPDGSPDYVPDYASYNQCPSIPGWRGHLAGVYQRLVRDLHPRGLYIDEYGATDGRWLCSARTHGHNGYEVPSEGELATLRAVREAVGPGVALYTEYPPFEAARQVLDGSFTYQAIWSADDAGLAPHCIDLPRFLFPRFKQFHITHYVPFRAGNWWVLNFPLFNGEALNIGEPNFATFDADSRRFVRGMVGLQMRYRDAFSSDDVEPLVPTLVPGLFANRFAGRRETVYTLYNAAPRTVRGRLLRVPHRSGTVYRDGFTGKPVHPVIRGGFAELSAEVGPLAVGLIVACK